MFFFKNLAYTIVVPSTLAIYIPWLLASEQSASMGMLQWVSIFLFLIGGASYSWCVWSFATLGNGTPAPFDAPTDLVIGGLYHYMRNPMYVSISLLLLGWLVLFPSFSLLLYGLSVGVCIHLFVILYEEPHLAKVFGTSYEEYRTQVGRWLPSMRRD